MKKAVCIVCVLWLIGVACACGKTAADPAAATPPETAAPVETAAPAPVPTEEPAPLPTATPVPARETALSGETVSRRDGISFLANTLTFAENAQLRLELTVENGTNKTVCPALTSLTVNGWMMDPAQVTADAAAIAPGETGTLSATVSGMDTENFSAMGIQQVQELGCLFRVTEQDTGEEVSVQSGTVTNPDLDPAYEDPFVRGDTVLLDNRGLLVALQSCDETLRTVRLYVEKKPTGAWASCCVAPVCAGYTDYLNPMIAMVKGSRMLLELDNGPIFDRNGITSLPTMDIYLTTQTSAKIDNSIRLTVENPAGGDLAAAVVPDESPVVFQDKYAILRYKGIDETIYPDKPVILIDLENITQTYIKTMEIIAYPAHATIRLDGVEYPLESHCTYSYPTTHGYLMLWPVGAPEGALKSAASAEVKLKLSRFRSGHLDPVTDTGWFTIPLQ